MNNTNLKSKFIKKLIFDLGAKRSGTLSIKGLTTDLTKGLITGSIAELFKKAKTGSITIMNAKKIAKNAALTRILAIIFFINFPRF